MKIQLSPVKSQLFEHACYGEVFRSISGKVYLKVLPARFVPVGSAVDLFSGELVVFSATDPVVFVPDAVLTNIPAKG